ncbi:amidohydrolase [Microbacterium sp.]|uniref:amidohydrolase n=1 Tax=Microbacterium sp. TaxID=51671 RepID=UPI002810F9CB|nr:amidohydrolase [Microbacterium sp.]
MIDLRRRTFREAFAAHAKGSHVNVDLVILAGNARNPGEPDAFPSPVALGVSAGRIAAIGRPEDVRATAEGALEVDLGDAVVYPGLVDSHAHPVWGSLSRGGSVALGPARSLDEVRALLAPAVASPGPGGWVTGFDFDLNLYPGEPEGRILDTWFPGARISLMTRDAHALIVSPAAVADLGLTGRETFPDASAVIADEHGPTGWVVELQAMDLVLERLPQAPLETQAQHLRQGLELLASGGLTGLHALDFHEPSEALLTMLEVDGELPLRVRASPLVPADSGPEEWERAVALQGRGGRRWQVAGVKFMLDGTADNGTAWFERPDCQGENAAALWRDTGAYRAAVRFFTERGIPTTTHAIGDAAVRFVLDVVAEVGHAAAGPHRIEHIESIPDDLLPRFAELGVVPGLQPTHATRLTSPDQSDKWSRRIGPERVAHGWRIRDLLDHGAQVALSSDWPIGVGDPRVSLADAQLRRPVELDGRAPTQPDQAIGAAEAYRAMTLAPAVAAGTASDTGRIGVGFVADLTVFARDPLALSPQEQAVNPVVATFVGGQRSVGA